MQLLMGSWWRFDLQQEVAFSPSRTSEAQIRGPAARDPLSFAKSLGPASGLPWLEQGSGVAIISTTTPPPGTNLEHRANNLLIERTLTAPKSE